MNSPRKASPLPAGKGAFMSLDAQHNPEELDFLADDLADVTFFMLSHRMELTNTNDHEVLNMLDNIRMAREFILSIRKTAES